MGPCMLQTQSPNRRQATPASQRVRGIKVPHRPVDKLLDNLHPSVQLVQSQNVLLSEEAQPRTLPEVLPEGKPNIPSFPAACSGQQRCASAHHVVFEDSLDHRREDFDHDHRARPLATVLQHTDVVRGQKRVIRAPSSATSPCRRTRTGQEGGGCFPGEERWPEHKHTRIRRRPINKTTQVNSTNVTIWSGIFSSSTEAKR